MYHRAHQLVAMCFAMVSLAPAAAPEGNRGEPASSAVSAREAPVVHVAELHPFTKVAYIPLGVDLSSIRFEGVKAVKVATKVISTMDTHLCEQGFQDPGGSMDCPSFKADSPMPAYQITYSYSGQPMASDEYGNTHFSFSVYFHPEELPAASVARISRAGTASLFKLSASRGFVQQSALDESNSISCDGNYVDGLWLHTNPQCEDQLTYKTVAVPSDYIAVKIDPAAR
jgi:hypothetical protein